MVEELVLSTFKRMDKEVKFTRIMADEILGQKLSTMKDRYNEYVARGNSAINKDENNLTIALIYCYY